MGNEAPGGGGVRKKWGNWAKRARNSDLSQGHLILPGGGYMMGGGDEAPKTETGRKRKQLQRGAFWRRVGEWGRRAGKGRVDEVGKAPTTAMGGFPREKRARMGG